MCVWDFFLIIGTDWKEKKLMNNNKRINLILKNPRSINNVHIIELLAEKE